ncbi:MAG: rhomboid family intramembrane serine protease [Candidatus Symbiothrix sp.]|jgi:membrane associated rhomboid family serine protease|nr:rhomboid family intramembrane serine protease [Candidatus Symbiothrix sp.]
MANFNNSNFSIPPVTQGLLIINVIIWLACTLFTRLPLVDILGLHYFRADGFYLYQLITYMFTHWEFSHLFFNMFALFMFGGMVERTWGPQRYLTYYMVTGIGAGLVQLLILYLQVNSRINGLNLDDVLNPQVITAIYNSYPITIGASGAIFGLLLAFGMLFPNAPIFFMFIPIPIKAKYFVIGYGVIEFFFGISNRTGDNVAHFAHLGGMLFGLLMIFYWKKGSKLNHFFYKKREQLKDFHKSPKTNTAIYDEKKIEQNKELNRILDKVKKSGYGSLSEGEKKTLFEY